MIWIKVVVGIIFGTGFTHGASKCGQHGQINGGCIPYNRICPDNKYAICLSNPHYILDKFYTCSYGTYPTADCDRCVLPPGEYCKSDGAPCEDGAECIGSKCVCLAGKQPGTNTCLKLTGMACTANSNCAEDLGLSCVNQVCACTPGNPCFKIFNERCSKDHPCDINPAQGMVCYDGHCVCPPNQKFVDKKCQLPFGKNCQSSPGRCGYNSICHSTSKTCQCGKFAAPSATTGFCECQDDAYRKGVTAQCACPSNAHSYENSCKCRGGLKLDINEKFCVFEWRI